MHYLVFFSVFLIAQVSAVKFTDCGSKTGKVVDVQLTGCEEDVERCELQRGESYEYKLTFESLTESQSLKAVVHGIMGGISMPYPLPNNDACQESGIECPVENGKTYVYQQKIEVQKSYPRVKADVKWELKDENNEDVTCILIPVKIV